MQTAFDMLQRFKDLIYERCHLSFPQSREMQLQRWVTQRAADRGSQTLEDYYRDLAADPKEFARLIGLITTRETYFFRMPEHFALLGSIVLPEIIDREGRRSLRALAGGGARRMRLDVWSAGCATGQEAYSLAMQILDTIRYSKAWDLQVLGTDLNADSLEIARLGRYDVERLGQMPAQFIERYFTVLSPDRIEVTEDVRGITTFRPLNLRDLPSLAEHRNAFDVIFCRNVMIYFDLAAQQRLVAALTDCLRPGGYLFTGEGEVLHLYSHQLEVREAGQTVFYRKQEEAS